MDDPADKITGEFRYNVALFLSVVLIIFAITLLTFICSRINLGYSSSSRVNTSARRVDNDNTVVTIDYGLDEATLNSFPKLMYSQAGAHKVAEEGVSQKSEAASCCPICLGEYKESDVVRLLPDCGHLFHQKCVDPWLRLRTTCPMCRSSPLPSPLCTPLAEVAPLAISL